MIDKKHILHVQTNIYTSLIEGKVSYKEPAIYETGHFYVLSQALIYCGLWQAADKHITSPSQKRNSEKSQTHCSGYYDRLKQTQRWIKSESRERTWSGLVLKRKKKKSTFGLVKTMIFPYPAPEWLCCPKTKPHTELRMWTTLSAVLCFIRPPSSTTSRLHRLCSTWMWHFVPLEGNIQSKHNSGCHYAS